MLKDFRVPSNLNNIKLAPDDHSPTNTPGNEPSDGFSTSMVDLLQKHPTFGETSSGLNSSSLSGKAYKTQT